ncbi:MAG TPA: S8 family serine peptidase, partial [Thermoanaerobaculia bacterium]|nr:S8 family serine peptidase [Thermoanaerobaculia bacterium]
PKKRPHLVLNLSLGWDPKLLHEQLGAIDPEDHLNAEELAVYDALAYAAENGALTISAAGNAIGGPIPELGPTLPAGWYARPPEVPMLPPSEETVIWAVGGVARGGKPLVNSRKDSEPGLVTYGDHAVVKLPKGGYTKPLTGTSVSAAVASAAAAVVWHLRPELSGREVMELLSASGSDLGRGAALYRSRGSADAAKESPPGVRQLGLSAALRAALAPKPAPAKPAETRAAGCHLLQVPANKVPAGCARRTYYTCDGVAPSCTADALPPKPVPGGVMTQPGANPCPSCSLGGGGGSGMAALRIEIDPDWPQGCLTDAMLEVETTDGDKIGIPISATAKELCPGDRLEVGDLQLPASIAAARISFKVAKEEFSVHSPVRVAALAGR